MPQAIQEDRSPRARAIVAVAAGIVVCIAAAVTAVVVLRHTPGQPAVTPAPNEPAAMETTASASASTIEQEAEEVAFLIMTSSSGWAGRITDVTVTTALRRPVIEVATDIGPEQAGLADDFASGLSAFVGGLTADDGSPYTYYLRIRSSEGDVIGTVTRSDDRWALDAPPAPGDAATLRSWLDAVYGASSPQPEAWVSRIGEVAADADGNIVVHTDLDPESAADQQVAQTIIDAVNSSGATFAPGVRVVFGDGEFEWSALLDGTDPYRQP